MARTTLALVWILSALLGVRADRRKVGHPAHHSQAALRGPRPPPAVQQAAAKDSAALLALGTTDAGRGSAEGAASAEEVVAEAERVAAHEEASLEAQAATDTVAGVGAADADGSQAEAESEERVAERRKASAKALQVRIVRARGLRFSDGKPLGVTDPYCVCEIPGKPDAKVQTQAIDGIHGVHWNHAGEIADYTPGDSLRCSIYEKDAVARNSFLGKVMLTSHQLTKGFKGELPLADAGAGVRAYLRLEVGRAGSLAEAKQDDADTEDTEDDDEGTDDADSEDEDDAEDDEADEADGKGKQKSPAAKITASAHKTLPAKK